MKIRPKTIQGLCSAFAMFYRLRVAAREAKPEIEHHRQ
jgi:hypothetical protein